MTSSSSIYIIYTTICLIVLLPITASSNISLSTSTSSHQRRRYLRADYQDLLLTTTTTTKHQQASNNANITPHHSSPPSPPQSTTSSIATKKKQQGGGDNLPTTELIHSNTSGTTATTTTSPHHHHVSPIKKHKKKAETATTTEGEGGSSHPSPTLPSSIKQQEDGGKNPLPLPPSTTTPTTTTTTTTTISPTNATTEGLYEILIVPHSHCDAGYKKTVEGYYLTEVSRTLESVTTLLAQDPSLRFVWAESSYLWRWWQDTRPSLRETFKHIVNNGQMELVNGGWVMHDEAITSYESQIHQMRTGHAFLLSLGFSRDVLPRIGWQIDPFGPSSWTPTFMALAGVKAWVTNRIPDGIKDQLRQNQSLEFYWNGSPSSASAFSPTAGDGYSGGRRTKEKEKEIYAISMRNDDRGKKVRRRKPWIEGEGKGEGEQVKEGGDVKGQEGQGILTHVMDTHYESPPGFDFEPPSQATKAPGITPENLEERADALMTALATKAKWYRAPLLFVPFGGDFEFQNASINFNNMSMLMNYLNQPSVAEKYIPSFDGRRPTLRYATPSEYFQRLEDLSPTLPTVRGSPFLPLVTIREDGGGDGPAGESAWSGYYSGYPQLKEGSREIDTLLRTAEVMMTMTGGGELQKEVLEKLAMARGEVDLMPHHDNLPATGYNFNTIDLEVRIDRARHALHQVIAQVIQFVATTPSPSNITDSSPGTAIPSSSSGKGEEAKGTAEAGERAGQGQKQGVGENERGTILLTAHAKDAFRAIEDGQPPLPILLVNSLGWRRKEMIEVRVSRSDLKVVDAEGRHIPSQATPIPKEDGGWTLAFLASVPPLGWSTYYLSVCLDDTHWTDYPSSFPSYCASVARRVNASELLQTGLVGERYTLQFSPSTCGLSSVVIHTQQQGSQQGEGKGGVGEEVVVAVNQSFQLYNGPGDSVYFFRPSGPSHPHPPPPTSSSYSSCTFFAYVGPLVQEAWGSDTTTAPPSDSEDGGGEGGLIQWSVQLVSSINQGRQEDEEVVLASRSIRWTAQKVKALGPFQDFVMSMDFPEGLLGPSPRLYLHENGYEQQDVGPQPDRPIGESYFPFVSQAMLASSSGTSTGKETQVKSQQQQEEHGDSRENLKSGTADMSTKQQLSAFHLIGHAPHGIASLRPGQVEVMLHRRAPYDITHGLRGNDQSTVQLSPIWLVLEQRGGASTNTLANKLAHVLQAPIIPLTLKPSWPAASISSSSLKTTYSALTQPFPPQVHLLSLSEPAFPVLTRSTTIMPSSSSPPAAAAAEAVAVVKEKKDSSASSISRSDIEGGGDRDSEGRRRLVTLQLQHIDNIFSTPVDLYLALSPDLLGPYQQIVDIQSKTLTGVFPAPPSVPSRTTPASTVAAARGCSVVNWGMEGEEEKRGEEAGKGGGSDSSIKGIHVIIQQHGFCTIDVTMMMIEEEKDDAGEEEGSNRSEAGDGVMGKEEREAARIDRREEGGRW